MLSGCWGEGVMVHGRYQDDESEEEDMHEQPSGPHAGAVAMDTAPAGSMQHGLLRPHCCSLARVDFTKDKHGSPTYVFQVVRSCSALKCLLLGA